MRLSGFSLAGILILSSTVFAQHATSGGSSSGSSSSSSGGSSGGGSHSSSCGGSNYSGGSSYSGSSGGHSSGGSSSGGSYNSGGGHNSGSSGGSYNSAGSRGGSGHGTGAVRGDGPSRGAGGDAVLRGPTVSGAASHRGVERESATVQTPRTGTSLLNVARPVHEPRESVQVRNVQPEKRSFLSVLRHPFRKAAPKDPEAIRGPLCFKGRCPVSPPRKPCTSKECKDQRAATYYPESSCRSGEVWNGGTCLRQTRFLDDCNGPRTAFERQAVILHQAEVNRQSACVAGVSQQCDAATTAWQSELNLYQQLQRNYQSCLQRQRLSSQVIHDENWFAPQFRLQY